MKVSRRYLHGTYTEMRDHFWGNEWQAKKTINDFWTFREKRREVYNFQIGNVCMKTDAYIHNLIYVIADFKTARDAITTWNNTNMNYTVEQIVLISSLWDNTYDYRCKLGWMSGNSCISKLIR